MPYIIDGHNLIPKTSDLSLTTIDDEIQLIEQLQRFCRKSNKRIEVYFDNAPPGQASKQNHGRVRAYFVSQGRTADEAIRIRLRDLGRSAQTWTVVSSDREVIAAVREARAISMRSEDFAKRLSESLSRGQAAPNEDAPLSDNEIEAWLRLFEERDQ
ncbi:MAG: NYN domain-containing protein [Chloroflexi bacterium]|nr:NYN domain-containing protein [Chloroflexota bacterium]